MAAITCVVAAFGIGGQADAAPARIQFRVEPKLYAEALLDVAQQANVTLIGAGVWGGTTLGTLVGGLVGVAIHAVGMAT